MAQKFILLITFLFTSQTTFVVPPELPPKLKAAIAQLIETPRATHRHLSQRKSREPLCKNCQEIALIEKNYENELFSFIFTPEVSPKDTQTLTLHVAYLREFIAQQRSHVKSSHYLDLLFLPQDMFERALGMTSDELPRGKKKPRTGKVDSEWRYVLSDFECLKMICTQLKILMQPNGIITLGKQHMHRLIHDYAGSLIDEDSPHSTLVQETRRISSAAHSFGKVLVSEKRNSHLIFEAKMRHLKLLKKILTRYLRAVPNSAFLQLPDGWQHKSSCKKKRINRVILAINALSDEILEQESEFLAQLTKKPLHVPARALFFDGCFGPQTDAEIA